MTVTEFCGRQGFSRQRAYALAAEGKLVIVRIAGRAYVTGQEARRFTKARKQRKPRP